MNELVKLVEEWAKEKRLDKAEPEKQSRKRKNAAIANGTYSKRGKSDGMYKMQGTDDCLGKR